MFCSHETPDYASNFCLAYACPRNDDNFYTRPVFMLDALATTRRVVVRLQRSATTGVSNHQSPPFLSIAGSLFVFHIFCVFVRLCNPFSRNTFNWTSPGRYFMVSPAPNHGTPGRGTVLWDDGDGGDIHIGVACRRREGQASAPPEANEEATPTDDSTDIDWGR